MKDRNEPCERPDEPWRRLPADPWLRPGTLRVELNGALIAIVMCDLGTVGSPNGPWMHHWLMDAATPWPIELGTDGDRLSFVRLNATSGDPGMLQGDPKLTGMFPADANLIVRTVTTHV